MILKSCDISLRMSYLIFAMLVFAEAAFAKGIVVLVPGAGSSGPMSANEKRAYFARYPKDLAAKGIETHVCPKNLDQDSRSIAERADDCASFIDGLGFSGDNKRNIVLVGHSMGGLIGRAIAQHPLVSGRIYAHLSLSTPHQGSAAADFAIKSSKKGRLDPLRIMTKLVGDDPETHRYLPEMVSDRRGQNQDNFWAQDMPNNPDVKYFSLSASKKRILSFPLSVSQKIVTRELKRRGLDRNVVFGTRNDGVVQEYSQVHGTYLGHVETHH